MRRGTAPTKIHLCLALALTVFPLAAQTPPAAKTDPLGRDTPRSSVSAFLEACNARDFVKASQYLDLRNIPASQRAQRGFELAGQLQEILNADMHFSVVRLSGDPQGDLADSSDPNREQVAEVESKGKTVPLDLERVTLSPGAAPAWLFSSDTVARIPSLAIAAGPSPIEKYLPPFFSNVKIFETELWKWIALLLAVVFLFALSRRLDRLLSAAIRYAAGRFGAANTIPWTEALLGPVRVIVCLLLFRVGLEVVGPAAIARLYIGRAAQAVFVWSVTWCAMRLVELALRRVESGMDEDHRLASRSVLNLGRRTINTAIAILAILLVLSNWGYNTSTLVAGLGVGGIAVALAAQQTIANVFGGVSVIADRPVNIGEYGKFGDLFGTIEDIGLRSTRVRTLSRTVVAVPNTVFAGYNLENYAQRDKILFNPTLQIKRSSPEEKIRAIVERLRASLAANKEIEVNQAPVRIVGLAGGAIAIEIFCWVLTQDIDRFYVIQGELYLTINRALEEAQIELV